jgi:hypothetical protein
MHTVWAQRREEVLSDCLVSPDVFHHGFPISTEKFYTVDDHSSHATKSNRTVIVWHLASS